MHVLPWLGAYYQVTVDRVRVGDQVGMMTTPAESAEHALEIQQRWEYVRGIPARVTTSITTPVPMGGSRASPRYSATQPRLHALSAGTTPRLETGPTAAPRAADRSAG